MRGFVRKRGSTYTWYFDVPDPMTGKRRQYSKGGFSDQEGVPTGSQRGPFDAANRHVRRALPANRRRVPGGGVAARHAPAESPALHLAQLPEERGAAHRSRPRSPAAPAAHAGAAHRLL
jgi:hypothetical protein